MTVRLIFRVGIVSIFILYLSESSAQSQWVIDKHKDGIEIYTRYERGSDFKSFKAVAIVDAYTDEIVSVLKDADFYSDWYGFTRTSKLLEQRENEQYNYVETIFPWPYKNRDMIYKMTIETIDGDTTKISLVGLPNFIPENNGIKRMRKAEGYLLLVSRNRQTKIIYVFHSEPGDNIPAWLANKSISELPFRTLSGLKSMLKKEKTSR